MAGVDDSYLGDSATERQIIDSFKYSICSVGKCHGSVKVFNLLARTFPKNSTNTHCVLVFSLPPVIVTPQ